MAPLKVVSIPRLELTAAALSVDVVASIIRELDLYVDAVYYWSDSRVVLSYIPNDSRRFQVFVANRVQRIRDLSSPTQWFYVASERNPADLASRGIAAGQLQSSIWLSGPDFLWRPLSDGPEPEFSFDENDPEVEKPVRVLQTKSVPSGEIGEDQFNNLSCWVSARRGVATLRRRVIAQRTGAGAKQYLQPKEISDAERFLYKAAQQAFATERKAISAKQTKGALKRSSPLYKLDPMIGDDDLIRVGGRLVRADPYDLCHPILMPNQGHITDMLIRYHHDRVQHQGRTCTLYAIRQAGVWIVSGRGAVARVIAKCIICRRLRGALLTQEMPPPFLSNVFSLRLRSRQSALMYSATGL